MCAAVAPKAHAQMTWTDKGFVNVTGGAQAGSRTLATATTFDIYDETASVSSSQDVKGGGFFDISAGYKVWRNLAVGLGYSHAGSNTDAAIAALIPDDTVTDKLRPVSASATDLKHSEGALHIMGVWMVPVTDKIDVGVSAGPSIFKVKQDLPTALAIAEPGPTVTGITITNVNKTTAGINFGVDVTYLVTKRIGVGGLARYTWGSADLEGASDKLTVGGFQIGGGVRLRF
jgi:hypothetical protein